ncbi:hypothetical protein Leryth_005691 [Lithospermum erythrorhizon]|nr:hypothetical protein Leryth_005691 [Lithospermum erythrorhizon]
MNSICKALCNESGVQHRFGNGVGKIEWLEDEDMWSLIGVNGEHLGHYKGVVSSDRLTFIPRVTSATGGPPIDMDVAPEMTLKVKELPVTPRFVLMLAFGEPLPSIPLKGFSFKNSEVLSWAYCESSKPGRSSACERWVLHSTVKYADNIIAQTGHQKLSSDTLTKIAEELNCEFESTIPVNSLPFFKRAHRWGSAFPSTSIADEEKCLWDGKKRLAVCGDFCVSPNVEGAVASGMAAAMKFTDILSSS